ncbi:hypothetical protein [Streptomyces shenzhenensis]|nr:hypothetical protein [Streptomyces shenzhenensis]
MSKIRRLAIAGASLVTLGIVGVNTPVASATELASTSTVTANRCIMMETP